MSVSLASMLSILPTFSLRCNKNIYMNTVFNNIMRILVFLHGTTIMHKNGLGHTREERVKQVIERDKSVHDYASYVPIGNAVKKLQSWKSQGAEILYLSSHENIEDVKKDEYVLKKYGFPTGQVFFREKGEQYRDIAERVIPGILIEDDCESIGGKEEMTITYIRPEFKKKIKSIVVKEFSGIDHLPDKISALMKY